MRHVVMEADLRKIGALSIVSKLRHTAQLPGHRPAAARGDDLEFTDYRRYNPGDDVRLIDWNLYARTRQPFIRRFQAEAELDLLILLDTSRSMQLGNPTKLVYARAVAAALAYVGLRNLDRVGLTTFSDRITCVVPPRRGKGQLGRLFNLLDDPPTGNGTDLQHVLQTYVGQIARRSLVCIVSDFFPSTAYAEGLPYLLHHNLDITVIHVLAVEELRPQIKGNVVLHDLEQDLQQDINAGPAVIARYSRRLLDFITSFSGFCRRSGITHVQLTTDLSFAQVVERFLRAGVWQRR